MAQRKHGTHGAQLATPALEGPYTLGGFSRRTLSRDDRRSAPSLTICDTRTGTAGAARYVTATLPPFGRTVHLGNLYAGADRGRSGSAEATADLDGCEFEAGPGGVRYCILRDDDDRRHGYRIEPASTPATTPAGLTEATTAAAGVAT